MPTYMLAITRTSYYHIQAERPDQVLDAYMDAADELEAFDEQTTAHEVYATNPAGHPVGEPLERGEI